MLVFVCSLSACNLREHNGEDQSQTNIKQVNAILNSLTYIKDESNDLCFAVLNNATNGFRNTFTIATVDCTKIKKNKLN